MYALRVGLPSRGSPREAKTDFIAPWFDFQAALFFDLMAFESGGNRCGERRARNVRITWEANRSMTREDREGRNSCEAC